MNRANAKKYLDVIKAFAEGATIESRDIGDKEWFEVESPTFSTVAEYRVKPESKVFYVNIYEDYLAGLSFRTREMADNRACGDRLAVLKVINSDGNISVEVEDV
jgi:hypothetical protein